MTFLAPLQQYSTENERQYRAQYEALVRALTPTSGRYTPVVTSSGGGETLTYTTQMGAWQRASGLIRFSVDILLATKSGGSGDIRVSLPAPGALAVVQTASAQIDNMGATWTGAPMVSIGSGATYFQLRELVAGAATAAWAKLGATGAIRVTGFYVPAA